MMFVEVDLWGDLALAVVKNLGDIVIEGGGFVIVVIILEVRVGKSFRILEIIAKVFNPKHSKYY